MDQAVVAEALSRVVNGIYILAVTDGDTTNAMPASWVTQVSANPPLVAVAVSPKRFSHDMIDRAGEFTLNFLSKDQGPLVGKCKLKGPDKDKKLEGLAVADAQTVSAPLLEETPVSLECKLHTAYSPGDHTLFIAEVMAAHVRSDEPILDIESYGKSYSGKE